MKLRPLCEKDAPLMLEWMHDADVVRWMKADFAGKTLADCRAFIAEALRDTDTRHWAVADDLDEYMGTVSLKHIDAGSAEFAIAMRRCAMGKGCALFGMQSVLRLALGPMGLKRVYWCVSPENRRAVRFYEKNGFQRCEAPEDAKHYGEADRRNLLWYQACGQVPSADWSNR